MLLKKHIAPFNIVCYENYIELSIKDNSYIELHHLETLTKEMVFLYENLYNKNKINILVNSPNGAFISPEAREHAQKKENNYFIRKIAIVSDELSTRIIVNFIAKITRVFMVTTRMFPNKTLALKWIGQKN